MPRFDFHCTACDQVFEETIPFGSKKLPPCPACGSTKTEKLLSVPGVLFKGGGFYKTDSSVQQSEPKQETPKSEPKKAEESPKTGDSKKS